MLMIFPPDSNFTDLTHLIFIPDNQDRYTLKDQTENFTQRTGKKNRSKIV